MSELIKEDTFAGSLDTGLAKVLDQHGVTALDLGPEPDPRLAAQWSARF